MKHDRAKARGEGDIGGELPMAKRETEVSQANSMPDTAMSDLDAGYCGYGSITEHTKSHPAESRPGVHNQGSRADNDKSAGGKGGY